MTTPRIRLFLADVDGTLVTDDKVLTQRAVEAVGKLKDAGILFAITSGRPPRGTSMLVEPLEITAPIAAFNGGQFIRPDMSIIEQKVIPPRVIAPVISLLESFGLDVWLYQGADWYVRDPHESHVDRESRTVEFAPTVVASFDGMTQDVVKMVGVSSDHEAVAAASTAAHSTFGDHVSAARSQPYYLDVTHPDANKGNAVQFLSKLHGIPLAEMATIGDMPTDVLMFAHCGLSIAMGNASLAVQRSARHVTTSNENEGFADAVDRFLLRDREAAPNASGEKRTAS